MIVLEKLGEKDLSEVHKIQMLVFQKLYFRYRDKGSPFIESKSSILWKIEQPNNYFYFIKNNGSTIGYVRISTNKQQTQAKIGPIGIIPENENRGYGTKVMGLIEDEFPKAKELCIGTILQEPKLIHFYSKIGYKQNGQIENIQKGMDIVSFVKKR